MLPKWCCLCHNPNTTKMTSPKWCYQIDALPATGQIVLGWPLDFPLLQPPQVSTPLSPLKRINHPKQVLNKSHIFSGKKEMKKNVLQAFSILLRCRVNTMHKALMKWFAGPILKFLKYQIARMLFHILSFFFYFLYDQTPSWSTRSIWRSVTTRLY